MCLFLSLQLGAFGLCLTKRREGIRRQSCSWGTDIVAFKIRRNKSRDERLCPSGDKETFWILGIREVGKDPSEHAEEARSQTELCLEGYQVSSPRQSHVSAYPWNVSDSELVPWGKLDRPEVWKQDTGWVSFLSCGLNFVTGPLPKSTLRVPLQKWNQMSRFWHGSHGWASSDVR